jgi:hypothetical protein
MCKKGAYKMPEENPRNAIRYPWDMRREGKENKDLREGEGGLEQVEREEKGRSRESVVE